jgi:hypothetical protein
MTRNCIAKKTKQNTVHWQKWSTENKDAEATRSET